MPDSKYFSTTNRGELFELKQLLNSQSSRSKREALKQIIASMTIGKDVSSLFTDVLNCMQTVDLELKKLVYLYLISYAKTQPVRCIWFHGSPFCHVGSISRTWLFWRSTRL